MAAGTDVIRVAVLVAVLLFAVSAVAMTVGNQVSPAPPCRHFSEAEGICR